MGAVVRHAAALVLAACASAPAAPAPAGVSIGAIAGRVVTPDGRPVEAVDVEVEGAGTRLLPVPRIATNERGRFVLDTVPIGDYAIHAATRFRTAATPPRPVAVVMGQTATVELVLTTLVCTDGPAPPPAWAVVHRSVRVLGLATFGERVTDTHPQVALVAVGACVGDPDVDRLDLLRRAGWDRATPAEREVLATAWVVDVLYAFHPDAAARMQGLAYAPPSAHTLPTGMIAVDSWQDVTIGLPDGDGEPRFQRIEWWLGPDAALYGPMVLDEVRLRRRP
jgi:hypothetical protein